MTDQEKEDLRCDILLFIATPTEVAKLRQAARRAELQFVSKTVSGLGEYFLMGMIGRSKVNAVLTDMGPFSHKGSASRAINYRVATGATAIIQLGMAFGVDPERQSYGDVLISTSIIPYDLREVRPAAMPSESLPENLENRLNETGDITEPAPIIVPEEPEPEPSLNAEGRTLPLSVESLAITSPQSQLAAESGSSVVFDGNQPYRVDYKHAVRHPSNESLLKMLIAERDRGGYDYRIHVGGMLSGGARVFSRRFLGELMSGVPQGDDGIIGGEMEGVGLLSVSPKDDPIWIVVKGISDFGDEKRDEVIKQTRPIACENSAQFVLMALAHS